MAKRRCRRKRRPKISSWKRLKSRFNLHRKLRLLGLALLVVLSTLVTLASLYLFRLINQPFVQAGSRMLPSSSWSGQSPANFAWFVVSSKASQKLEEAAVLHLDPSRKQALLIRMPPKAAIENGSGEAADWLGELSKRLALPIQGYFLVDREGLSKLGEVLGADANWMAWRFQTLSRIPSLFPILRRHLVTNLSLGEILKVSRFVLSLRESQKIEVSSERVGEAMSSCCFDEKIKDEGAKILVLNGTFEAGLAARAARWVENLGGFVLDVGNAPQQNYERSVLLVSNPSSYTAQILAESFGISNLRGIGESLGWMRRADIVLILGLDKKDFF